LLSVLRDANLITELGRNQQRMKKGTNHPRCATIGASGSAYTEQDIIPAFTIKLVLSSHQQPA
jgi:hypothetical protein